MSEDLPETRSRPRPTRRAVAAAVTGAGIAVSSGGLSLLLWGNPGPASGVASGSVAAPGQVGNPLTSGPSPAAGRALAPAAPPVRIDVPSIRLSSELTELKLQDDGTLGVPKDPAQAGWWSEGVAPGDPGPAIIVGHVDSMTGPAVFYRLSEVRPGDRVLIARADGTTVTYSVDGSRQYPKDDFPGDLVYGSTDGPTLRLLTCGGNFDRRSGHYTDNLVVFAHLLDIPAAVTPSAVPPPPTGPKADPRALEHRAVRAR